MLLLLNDMMLRSKVPLGLAQVCVFAGKLAIPHTCVQLAGRAF